LNINEQLVELHTFLIFQVQQIKC